MLMAPKYKSPRATDPTAYTPEFTYKPAGKGAHAVYCEGVPVASIADAVGTPTYVYSRASIEAAYRGLDRAFGSLPHTLCYAMKANSNLAVLQILARLGSSFDIVSGGELDRLRPYRRSRQPHRFLRRGKNARGNPRGAALFGESRVRRSGILMFNIESGAELEVLLSEAARHVAAGGDAPSRRPFA